MGPKKLAVLMGWPYTASGSNLRDLKAVMTNYIAFALPEQLALFSKQWECRCTELCKMLEL